MYSVRKIYLLLRSKPLICELEVLHGVELGSRYKNRQACTVFVEYIAQDLVQLSLDYPNTWSPHLIRMAEIFGYQNEPRPSIIIRVPLHAKSTNDVQSSYTNVLVLDIMQLQWTEQGSKLYC